MMKLILKNLSFSYGARGQLFDSLSFEVKAGECFFVGGANGSGKTTLLRILAGLQDFSQGELWVERDEEKFTRFPRDYLSTEWGGHFAHLSALENLSFWLEASGVSFDKKQLLEEAHQWGFPNRYTFEKLPVKRFSTGMKKKLSLMRVFFRETPLLFLDEPLNGLDERSCEYFVSKLEQLKKRGDIIVLSSHGKLGLCESLIDRKLLLSRGKGNQF